MLKILMLLALLVSPAAPSPVPEAPPIGVSAVMVQGVPAAAYTTLPGAPAVLIALDPALVASYLPDTTAPSGNPKGQTLTTQVYDAVSDTYTEVVTVRGENETVMDFIRRHNKIVDTLLDENVARATARGIDYKSAKKDHDHPSN